MDILQSLFSNVWAGILVVLFFGGSIFVHELGHFLAARWRGVKVERFSIGFGPKIFSWRGKDGVEYRISWLPLGGYVALPQLADMSAIEGKSTNNAASLPPPSYATKVIVFVAGAVFNVIFAFLLACIIWKVGLPESSDQNSNVLGYISPTLKLSNKTEVPSPAAQAGLKVGDIVRAIDGKRVKTWTDIQTFVGLGSARSSDGRRLAIFTVERDGQLQDITVYPQIAGEENDRKVGIAPGYPLLAGKLKIDGPAEKAGFKSGDEIFSIDGTRILNAFAFEQAVVADGKKTVSVVVRRHPTKEQTEELTLVLPSIAGPTAFDSLGLPLSTDVTLSYPNPFEQIEGHAVMMYRSLVSLISPHSDVGPSKMISPVGIIRIYFNAAEAGLRAVFWLTILINVNLALFNLLPIPVLDGGHIMFATIARLRGKPLPFEFMATLQSIFMVLLLSFVLYVGFFDFRRMARDHRAETEAKTTQSEPAAPTPVPAPVAP